MKSPASGLLFFIDLFLSIVNDNFLGLGNDFLLRLDDGLLLTFVQLCFKQLGSKVDLIAGLVIDKPETLPFRAVTVNTGVHTLVIYQTGDIDLVLVELILLNMDLLNTFKVDILHLGHQEVLLVFRMLLSKAIILLGQLFTHGIKLRGLVS